MGRRADNVLTDSFVRAISKKFADAGGRADYPDGGCAGLQLRLSGRSATWAFRYRDALGKSRRHKLGEYPDTSLSTARELAGDLRKGIRLGADPREEQKRRADAARALEAKAITFRQIAEAYEKDAARRKAGTTIALEAYRMKKHILPALGSIPFAQVARRDVRGLAEKLADAGHGVLANRVCAQIGAIYRWAETEHAEIPARNPAVRLRLHDEQPRARVLADDEIKRLWTALQRARRPRDSDEDNDGLDLSPATAIALSLVLVTGQRAGEVVGMAAVEVDLTQKTWAIDAGRVKNRRHHVVPLSPLAIELIKEAAALAGKSAYLFPGAKPHRKDKKKDAHLTRHAVTRAMARVCRGEGSLKIPDATVHDLRRTAATIMASERLGISRYIVSRVLNHTSDTGGAAVVTQVYARSDDLPAKRHALESWARLLEEIADGKPAASNVVALVAAQ